MLKENKWGRPVVTSPVPGLASMQNRVILLLNNTYMLPLRSMLVRVTYLLLQGEHLCWPCAVQHAVHNAYACRGDPEAGRELPCYRGRGVQPAAQADKCGQGWHQQAPWPAAQGEGPPAE